MDAWDHAEDKWSRKTSKVFKDLGALLLTWPGLLLDMLYDRFDLWSSETYVKTGNKVADYSKVRGLILYATVVWFTILVGIHTKTITLGFLWFLLAILGASISERAFMAVVKSWADIRKTAAGAASDSAVAVELTVSPLRDPVLGIDPPVEPSTAPTGDETGTDPVPLRGPDSAAFVLPSSLISRPAVARLGLLTAPVTGVVAAGAIPRGVSVADKQSRAVVRVLTVAKAHGWGQEDRKYHKCKVGAGAGDNHGQFVEFLQHNVGNVPGDPWCMSFAVTMMKLALGTVNPLPLTGGCQWMYDWAVARQKKVGKTLLFDKPEMGDMFLLYTTSMGRYAHTGFVNGTDNDFDGAWEMRWDGPRFFTVEGNTNDDGSRDGFGVFERYRAPAGMKFLRWKLLVA
jgi:hypothetical protein